MGFSGRFAVAVGTVMLLAGGVHADSRVSVDQITGVWLTEKKGVVIDLYECEDDGKAAVCGRIAWLREPYTDDGRMKRDLENPDPDLRDRPLCGINVITGLQRNDRNTWIYGRVYNPKNGKNYRAYVNADDDGTLHIRAYLGIPLIGKSEDWTRPQGIDIGCPAD